MMARAIGKKAKPPSRSVTEDTLEVVGQEVHMAKNVPPMRNIMRFAVVSGRDLKILNARADATPLSLPEYERRQQSQSQEEPFERRGGRPAVRRRIHHA